MGKKSDQKQQDADMFDYAKIKAESHVITITVHFDDDQNPYLMKFPIDRTCPPDQAALIASRGFRHLLDNTLGEIKKRLHADHKARFNTQ